MQKGSEKLKLCPFCGGKAIWDFDRFNSVYTIGCQEHTCRGYGYLSKRFFPLAKAITAWNRRVSK
jgi:hypothetical protein